MERHTHEHPIRIAPRNPDLTVRGDSKYTPSASYGYDRLVLDNMHHDVMYRPSVRIEGAEYMARQS